MSEKTKEQKEQLKQQINERKKNTDRTNISSRRSSQSIGSKASKETVAEHKPTPVAAKKEQQFEIKEKYDMYEMEFEDEGDS